jgi:hypothetical protein
MLAPRALELHFTPVESLRLVEESSALGTRHLDVFRLVVMMERSVPFWADSERPVSGVRALVDQVVFSRKLLARRRIEDVEAINVLAERYSEPVL